MIRKLFGRSDRVASEYRRAGGELGVFTLALAGVEDLFDPDPLWDRKYGGGARIREKTSGAEGFRLEAALDGCRDSVFARDEAGRFRERNPVFTDVVMWIPEAAWDAEALRGGRKIEALATNLALLHQGKFRGSLPADRPPVYTVMPDPALAADEVVLQFGFGVFVPGDADVQQAVLRMRRGTDGEPVDFPAWSFWQDGAQIRRPVGVYKGQKSVLIAPGTESPIRAPVWLARREGHILLNLNAADSQHIYPDDERIEVVEVRKPSRPDEPFAWVLAERGQPGGERIVIELAPLTEADRTAAAPAAVSAPGAATRMTSRGAARPSDAATTRAAREPAERPASPRQPEAAGRRFGLDRLLGGFSLGRAGEATPLSDRFALRLAGLALMRIDGEHRLSGLLEWTIYFDDDGRPVPFERADAVDAQSCLALQGNCREAKLLYRLAGERAFKPVAGMPCVLPTRHRQYLDLLPPPVPGRFLGLLLLKEEMVFPLSPRPLVLGRSNLDPNAPQPDLPLELLTHPESLRWVQGGGYPGAKLNAVNLSRRHLSVQLRDGGLDLEMAEGTSPVYVLDRDGALQQELEPNSRHRLGLKPGQAIVVGSYLLRFHEERARTMRSSEHTLMRQRAGA